MRAILCAAVVGALAIAPGQAHAGALGATIAGGIIGGLAGSVYAYGSAATVASVGSGVTNAAAMVPAAVGGTAAFVAATSTPIVVGVVGGAAVAYLLYDLAH